MKLASVWEKEDEEADKAAHGGKLAHHVHGFVQLIRVRPQLVITNFTDLSIRILLELCCRGRADVFPAYMDASSGKVRAGCAGRLLLLLARASPSIKLRPVPACRGTTARLPPHTPTLRATTPTLPCPFLATLPPPSYPHIPEVHADAHVTLCSR